MARYLIQVAMLLAATAYAWRRGGWPEWVAAAILGAMFAIDRLYHFLVAAPQYRQLDLWHMSLDLVVLAAIVALALRAPRTWLLWMASLQLISALGHGLHVLEVGMPWLVYWTMTTAPSYMQILLLAAGTFLNDPRRRARRTT